MLPNERHWSTRSNTAIAKKKNYCVKMKCGCYSGINSLWIANRVGPKRNWSEKNRLIELINKFFFRNNLKLLTFSIHLDLEKLLKMFAYFFMRIIHFVYNDLMSISCLFLHCHNSILKIFTLHWNISFLSLFILHHKLCQLFSVCRFPNFLIETPNNLLLKRYLCVFSLSFFMG